MSSATLAGRMLATYPRNFNVEASILADCIAACADCATACTLCADDCLSEPNVAELVKCIRLELDCADICATTGRIVSRQTEYDANITRALVEACIAACTSCGDECRRHGEHGMEHCRVCADECDRCRSACEALIAAIG